MKKINIYFSIALLISTLMSCETWLDVNTDPNNPTNVSPEFVLPTAQASIGGMVGGELAAIGGLWSQHWTQSNVASQYKTIDAYNTTKTDYDNIWRELYAGGLNDLEDVKTKAIASGNNNLVLQSVALQSYAFQILADCFDKIPYSEALTKGVFYPKFDDGASVYKGIETKLDEALALDFSNGKSTSVKTDLIFGTLSQSEQIASWKKFVYTLKLKMLLRQSNVLPAATLTSRLATLLSDETRFLTTSASITQFKDEINRSNPLYENSVRKLNVGTNLRLSYTLFSFLSKNSDPRLDAYFTKGSLGSHFGLPQGDYERPTTSVPGGVPSVANISPTQPFNFFSLDEVYFLLSEAFLRTGNSAKAKSYYDKAIAASFSSVGLTLDSKLIATGGVYAYPLSGTTDEQLKAIISQKWVASVYEGYESFWDQARTGYPEISKVTSANDSYVPGQWTYSVNGVTGGLFPKRLLFPNVSSSTNINTPALVKITEKIWWMK